MPPGRIRELNSKYWWSHICTQQAAPWLWYELPLLQYSTLNLIIGGVLALILPRIYLKYRIYCSLQTDYSHKPDLWREMRVTGVRRIIHSPSKETTRPIITCSKSLHTFLIRELVWAGIILAPQDPRYQTLHRIINIITKLGRVEEKSIPLVVLFGPM